MKVLMYGWEFPPNINGGLGIACYEIVEALLEQGVNIHLVLPTSTTANAKKITRNGFEVQFQFIHSLIKPYITEDSYTSSKAEQEDETVFGHDLVSEVKRYGKVAGKLAKDVQHDVIHVHDWLTVLAGIEAKKISKKPLFFHVHSLETDRSGLHVNQAVYDIEKYGLEQADKIFAVSHYTRECIIRHYNIAPDKIIVAYNGIPRDYLHNLDSQLPEKDNLVLFLGRITHQKGPFHFIDVARKVLSKRQDITFVMAGQGDLYHDAIEYVAKNRLGSFIHFAGFLDREYTEKMYKLSKVFVMPSVSEPFGLTCLEALTLQLPVIVSKHSGVSEFLNHVVKVDFWDIDEMANKIIELVDYPVLRQEMNNNAKRELRQLKWSDTAQVITNSYHKVREL